MKTASETLRHGQAVRLPVPHRTGRLSPLPPPYEDFNPVTIPPLNPEKSGTLRRPWTTRWPSASPNLPAKKKRKPWFINFFGPEKTL